MSENMGITYDFRLDRNQPDCCNKKIMGVIHRATSMWNQGVEKDPTNKKSPQDLVAFSFAEGSSTSELLIGRFGDPMAKVKPSIKQRMSAQSQKGQFYKRNDLPDLITISENSYNLAPYYLGQAIGLFSKRAGETIMNPRYALEGGAITPENFAQAREILLSRLVRGDDHPIDKVFNW